MIGNLTGLTSLCLNCMAMLLSLKLGALEIQPNLQQLTHQLAQYTDTKDAKGEGEAVSSQTDMLPTQCSPVRSCNILSNIHLAQNFLVTAHINRKTKTKNLHRLKKKKDEWIYDSGRKCQMLLTMQLLKNLKSKALSNMRELCLLSTNMIQLYLAFRFKQQEHQHQ